MQVRMKVCGRMVSRERKAAVCTRACRPHRTRSRRSRLKTLLYTARSERKRRSKVSKKSVKQLSESGREMTGEACKIASGGR